jgi:hypothetical protein
MAKKLTFTTVRIANHKRPPLSDKKETEFLLTQRPLATTMNTDQHQLIFVVVVVVSHCTPNVDVNTTRKKKIWIGFPQNYAIDDDGKIEKSR